MEVFWFSLITMCFTVMLFRPVPKVIGSTDALLVQGKIILSTFFKEKRYFLVTKSAFKDVTLQDHAGNDITREMEPFLGFNFDFFNQANNITVSLVNEVLRTNFESIKVCCKDTLFSFELDQK